MNIQSPIGQRISEKGWTSAHLAAALHELGFDPHPLTVERWAEGKSEPRGIKLTVAVAKALDCEVSDLVTTSEVAS